MSWNSMHMCPIKGVQATSSASRDFKSGPDGGPGLDLANESTEMAVDLMSHVNAKSVMAPVMRDIWKRAAGTCVSHASSSFFLATETATDLPLFGYQKVLSVRERNTEAFTNSSRRRTAMQSRTECKTKDNLAIPVAVAQRLANKSCPLKGTNGLIGPLVSRI